MTPAFVPAEIGPNWSRLPLPALIVDTDGRIAAMNDLAEPFLNLSQRFALGQELEGAVIQQRLRIIPAIDQLIARTRTTVDAISHVDVRFEIGDRAGGHYVQTATLHLGQATHPEGAVMILIAPTAARLGHGVAIRAAARSAIGMADMLAHEIKNPLAGIRGAAQLLAMNLGAEDRDLADLIVAESRRIVALLEQVERFGDTTAPRMVPVNVHDILERVRRSSEVGFAQGIRIATDYDPSLPPALADPDQLMQVCLNLVKNSAEALQRGGRQHDGTIRIRSFYDGTLRMAPTDGRPSGLSLPLQIEIEDDGPGIPDAISDQIFEPFVSGRENGTGLGLALVSKILSDHGAWLNLDSRPGRTIFRISLPKA